MLWFLVCLKCFSITHWIPKVTKISLVIIFLSCSKNSYLIINLPTIEKINVPGYIPVQKNSPKNPKQENIKELNSYQPSEVYVSVYILYTYIYACVLYIYIIYTHTYMYIYLKKYIFTVVSGGWKTLWFLSMESIFEKSRSSLEAQNVKDLALSLLWLGSLLWYGFDPGPRNFCMLQVWPKKNQVYPPHHMSLGKCKLKQQETTIPIRMAKIWNNANTKCWRRCGATGNLLVRIQNSTATLEDSLAVSYETKHVPALQSSDHALWYLPKVAENLCTWVFISALFIAVRTWKQPRYSSVGGINKLLYIQTMGYYSVLKRNKLSSLKIYGRNLMYITKWTRPIWKGQYVWFHQYDTLK